MKEKRERWKRKRKIVAEKIGKKKGGCREAISKEREAGRRREKKKYKEGKWRRMEGKEMKETEINIFGKRGEIRWRRKGGRRKK